MFVDGKADRKLYAKIFALARRYGREDDVFVWNFLTLDARDSMTCNPFGPASADTIREILVGQLTEPGQGGNGGVLFGRAVGFLGAIAPVLTWVRDEHGIPLDLEKIRDATELSNVVLLATTKQIRFTDSATGRSELLELPDMPAALVQHSYVIMQFTEVLGQWLVSLGHILKVRTDDVDMADAGGPTGGDGLELGAEAYAFQPVHVVVAEQAGFPVVEGMEGYRHGDGHVDSHHAHLDPVRGLAPRVAVPDEHGGAVAELVLADHPRRLVVALDAISAFGSVPGPIFSARTRGARRSISASAVRSPTGTEIAMQRSPAEP